MNASLEEPDFLSCSITLTQPVQASRHRARRAPKLSFAKYLLKEKIARTGPMAARKPQNNYAADQAVAKHAIHPLVPAARANMGLGQGLKQLPPPHVLRAHHDQLPLLEAGPEAVVEGDLQRLNGQFGGSQDNPGVRLQPKAVVKKDSFPPFVLEDIPHPPHWLSTFISSQMANLPLTDSDDAILAWFQSLEHGIVKIAVKMHAMSPRQEKKKISNADRFRLKLPPVPPKALIRPNKPAPFILPGMDYTEEEIEALGLQNYIKTASEPEEEEEETVTIYDSPSIFWGRVMKTAFASTAKTVRRDVMDALWFILDTVSRPDSPEKKPVKPLKPKPAGKENGKPNTPLEDSQKPVKATDQQQAFLRPGQLAAGQVALSGPKLKDTVKADRSSGKERGPAKQQIPILQPKKLLDTSPAGHEMDQAGGPFMPKVINGQLGGPPVFEEGSGGILHQKIEGVPKVVDGRLGPPPTHKDKPVTHDAAPGKAQQALIDFSKLTADDKEPSHGQGEEEEDLEGIPDDEDDPYARERQRSIQKANNLLGAESRGDLEAEDAIPPRAENDHSEALAGYDLDDEQSLLKLLALKQQELADLRRKLASGQKPKRPQPNNADTGKLVQNKESKDRPAAEKPFAPLNPLKPQKQKQAQLGKKDTQSIPKGEEGVAGKLVRPLQPMKPIQGQPRKLQDGQVRVAPLQPAAHHVKDVETGDVFEQHIRKASKAKVKKLEEQIQPEKLLDLLEKESFARGGGGLLVSSNNKLMMAGMAKARPDARK